MQNNVMRSIVIVLGIGVAAAYCLHLGSEQERSTAFEPAIGGLKPLPSFDRPEPDIATLVTGSAEFAKLEQDPASQHSIEPMSLTEIAPPERAEVTNELFTRLPAMPRTGDRSASGIVAGSHSIADRPEIVESPEQIVSSTLEAPAPAFSKQVARDSRSQQIRAGWQKNPFVVAGANVSVEFNSSQAVKSLIARSPQVEGPISEMDDIRVQLGPTTEEGLDQNFQIEMEPSILVDKSSDTDSTTDFTVLNSEPESFVELDGDLNSFLPPATMATPGEIETDSTPAHQPDSGVAQNTADTVNTADTANTSQIPAPSRAAAQQSAQHIEYGKSLARRGAVFASRQEFFLALSIIAQSKDETVDGTDFSRALTRGFLALKETEGFVFDNVEAETTLDVASIVETHRSNVLPQEEASLLSPAQASQKYFEFALEQLDYACGRNVVSAEAFFCLGKMYSALSKTQSVPSNLDTFKSIVFHQAALKSDDKNYRSANELGVLMTQTGQLQEATEYFKRSLMINRTPQAWMNLAKTHRRLGEDDFAEKAELQYELATQAPLVNSPSAIQWMPTENFNGLTSPQDVPNVASKPSELMPTSTGQNKLKSLTESFSQRLKELF